MSQKGGLIKAYDSVSDTTPTTVADLSADVMNYWDRGLLNLVVDPAFPTKPYLYVFSVWGGSIGEDPQRWGDSCPTAPGGPGSTTDGCVASGKVERLTIDPSTNQLLSRKLLLWDVCQQFPSHAGGAMAFGADGQLYVALGDGANFNGLDYGQYGGTVPDPTNPYTPVNPCGDPVTVTSPAGTTPVVDVPTAEGGALRGQDVRTTGDPTGLGGALVRIDPATGVASAGNPLASSADANTKRIVATGFRNPYRLTFRPGTSELYLGNVGNHTWEAIDKLTVPASATPTTIPNAGWPCYEGPGKAPGYSTLATNLCEGLYAQGAAAWQAPFYCVQPQRLPDAHRPLLQPERIGRRRCLADRPRLLPGPERLRDLVPVEVPQRPVLRRLRPGLPLVLPRRRWRRSVGRRHRGRGERDRQSRRPRPGRPTAISSTSTTTTGRSSGSATSSRRSPGRPPRRITRSRP